MQKVILVLCSVFLFSCSEVAIENIKTVDQSSVGNLTSGPVLDRILALGYTGKDIVEYKDYFMVDGDISFPKCDTVSTKNVQLRQSSVSVVPVTKRTIQVDLVFNTFWGQHQEMARNGLIQAVAKFNSVNSSVFLILAENFIIPSSSVRHLDSIVSKITINGNLENGLSSADYPNGELAGMNIRVNETMMSNQLNLSYLTYESIFMHSLGHCLGLKNMEDTDGVPISGTTTYDPYSIMRNGFLGTINLSTNDKVAILALYPSDVKGAFDLGHSNDLAIGFDYNSSGYENLMFYRAGNQFVYSNFIDDIADWYPKCAYLNIAQGNGTYITKNISYYGLGGYDLSSKSDKILALDCDGNGVDELFCYRPGKQAAYLLKLNTSTSTFEDVIASSNGVGGFNFGDGDDKAISLDYNGDKVEELLCYRPGSKCIFIMKFDNASKVFNTVKEYRNGIGSFNLDQVQDKIIALYYNNDSYEDIMCYRPGKGVVYIMTSNGDGTFNLVLASTTGLRYFNFGSELDRAVVMNYNNDQYDDIICYRPGSQVIHLLKGNGTTTYEPVYMSTNGTADFDLMCEDDKIVSLNLNRKRSNRIVLYRPGHGVAYSAHYDGTTFVRDTPQYR